MISIDPTSAVSPVEQIRSQLAARIRTGQLTPDTRLPPVRQLAADLRVAPGSVAKAYKELESAGLIRTMRAAGTRVNPGHATTEPLINTATELVRQASQEGLSLQETQGLLAHAWTQQHPPTQLIPEGHQLSNARSLSVDPTSKETRHNQSGELQPYRAH